MTYFHILLLIPNHISSYPKNSFDAILVISCFPSKSTFGIERKHSELNDPLNKNSIPMLNEQSPYAGLNITPCAASHMSDISEYKPVGTKTNS
jgi:hypothetical protein